MTHERDGWVELDRARRHRTARRVADLITAVAAGFVVFLLLNPARTTDAEPPVCTAVAGWAVPCGSTLAGVAAGTATFVVGALLIWAADRRQRRADRR